MNETTLSPLLATSATGFLVVETGSLAGQRYVLPAAPGALLLGRERLCNVRFDPDRDRVVGRTHARIEVREEGIYLVDLNSANGTFREGGVAVRGAIPLQSGVRFQLGGEGGPWLSVQLGVAPQAVHVMPPRAEQQTLITRPSPEAVHVPAPGAIPSEQLAASPPVNAAVPSPLAPISNLGRGVDREPPIALKAAVVDAQALAHRRYFVRQIVVIALVLVSACVLGLLLGLRDVQADPALGEQSAR